MSLDANIRYADKRTSVKVGDKNAPIIMRHLLEWLDKKVYKGQQNEFIYDPLPKYHPLDYVVWKDLTKTEVLMQVEVKTRNKFYWDTMIPTRKEIQAREDFNNYDVRSFYVAYYQDRKATYIYDILNEPARRETGIVGRPDRPNDIDDYSYYNKYIIIREGKDDGIE